jgi:hypothetical protein
MARIYVSSTFQDLRVCREQVRLTLRRMDYNDIAMEYYTAEDTRPLDKCLRDVDACDLYICLVAWRYGYVPDGHQYSITELEYRRAVRAGKPCLAFLLDEEASWPFSRVERNALDKVEAFRSELKRNHATSFFTGPEDIGARVAEAVHKWGNQEGVVATGDRTNWEAYRAAIFEKHRWIRLAVIAGAKQDRRFAQIPLSDVFVAQQTTSGHPTYDIPDAPLADTAQLEEPPEASAVLQEPSLEIIGRESKQVILGGPGSGKSTLFHYAMLALCDPVPSETAIPVGLRHGPLPFLIELRQYSLKRANSFVEYLTDQTREFYGVDVEADDLRNVLRELRRALVLFDGLDEILNPAERSRIVDQFDTFTRQYSGADTIVSSRIVGYDPERLQLGGFSHYTLLDFGLTEIREFVPRWYRHYTWQGDERDAAGLLQRINGSPRLLDLAGNPLLVTMMAVIYKHQDLPEKRWQLYERCTQVLLEDWDVKRKNIERDELLPLDFRMVGEQKAEILANVSMHMLLQHREGGELNAIARGPLIEVLATYLQLTYNKAPGDARAIATDILNHLRERTYILAEIGESIFGFVHRTFMEYFAASHARAEFNRRRADYSWLTQEVFGAHWQRDEWREILLLLIAMLKDQGSPIEEVVDHLLSFRVGQPPWNLAFAARCLGEAGATDGPWEQDILNRLVKSILRWAGETSNDEIARFVNEELVAFSMLVSTVRPAEKLIASIQQSGSRSRRHRMVAWQMELTLRLREERFVFAAAALKDPEEAVRLGAIAALEREWPGRDVVGVSLVEILRLDRVTRVRQAAVQALRRSWPEQPGILEAISERTEDETAYTHVIWLIRYLSSEWRHDLAALEVVLRLAGTKRRPPSGYSYRAVTRTAARGIADGWGDVPGILSWLQNQFDIQRDPHIRSTILAATAHGWPGDPGLLEWLQKQRIGLSPDTRLAIIDSLARAWKGRPDALAFIQQWATDDDAARVRMAALNSVARWREHLQVRTWLEERAVSDPTPAVRAIAVLALSRYWRRTNVDEFLRHRAIADPAAEVRLPALLLATGRFISPSWPLSVQRVATHLEDLDELDWRPLVRAEEGRDGPSAAVALLEARAVDDPTPSVRKAAVRGVFHYRANSATAFDLLLSRLSQDSDRDVRAMALLCLARIGLRNVPILRLLQIAVSMPERLFTEPAPPVTRVRSLERPLEFEGEDERLRAAFKHAAEHDTDAGVRVAAALAFAYTESDDAHTFAWLSERIRREQDPAARSFLEGAIRPER